MSRFYNTVNAALADQVSKDEVVSRDVLKVLRRDFQKRYDIYLSEIGQLTYHDAIEEFLQRDSEELRMLEKRLATAVENNAILRKLNEDNERLKGQVPVRRSPILRKAIRIAHAIGIKNTGVLVRLRRVFCGS